MLQLFLRATSLGANRVVSSNVVIFPNTSRVTATSWPRSGQLYEEALSMELY